MEMLKVENLSAGYGKQRIVNDVSLSVEAGELVGIFGENGCGKTTLFRAITGLGTRMSGLVSVDGHDITNMTVRRRAQYLSMLPAVTEIPEGVLAEEVLEMGWYACCGFLKGPDRAARETKKKILKELELWELANQYFDRLSQGQKQMVLLGRMLLQDTPVFFMDEPDVSLDFKHKHSLFRKMRSIAAEKSKAGLMILHDPSLVLTYCDRVFLMKKGELMDVICPALETEREIARKIEAITGRVRVTKQENSVIIFP